MKKKDCKEEQRALIVGADGLAKQCLQILGQPEFQNTQFTFFDDVNEDPHDFGHSIETCWKNVETQLGEGHYTHYVICLGNPRHRRSFSEKLSALNPLSIISARSNRFQCDIGSGCIILDEVLIEPFADIGNQVLLNHGAKVFHDVVIGKYCEISPGATILGKTKIGEGCRIGSNATILPDLTLGKNCIVGAGAVVTKNLPDNAKVVGIPAR